MDLFVDSGSAIKTRFEVLLKIALNRVLTLPDDGKCPAFLISCGIVDLGAFCVELWPKQVLHRISVPMSYISFFCCSYIVSFVVKSPSGGKNP